MSKSHVNTLEITLIESINLALDRAMTLHPEMVILGEDVGINGGVFRATEGLREKYGLKRVMDTPLAEALIAGVTVGMSAQGLRPVAEIQFMGFIFSAMEQLTTHAARFRNRTRGRLNCPMVIRAPYGGGIHAPEHHSESTEALFAHIPGLRVVIPSSPIRAYGLLLAAIESNDPVIFLEPKRIYRLTKSRVIDNGLCLPLDSCFILRAGSDITLVSWGAMITETMEAAEELAVKGIECEVIDLVTISPIDRKTIINSVKKTGRCCVIHEASRSCGVGAEIAACVSEYAFPFLKASISRVCGYDTVMPYFQNEHYYLPSTGKIVDTVSASFIANKEVNHAV
ncbi:MAG: 2-oxoisovalerate dehydrogenase E1 component beta subunit [Pseudohongiellaceae bacterium]|jgi:2-oxoisovalerate dehydrogenase E1 component beta subunit